MSRNIHVRTGVWYGDRLIDLPLPDEWEVDVRRPAFPPPLTDGEIDRLLDNPVNSASIQELCKGKKHPLVIVDDLNRPTPAAAITPHLLRRMEEAGITAENVTFLMATGSHGLPDVKRQAMLKKVGPVGAGSSLLVHDCFHDAVRFGKTRAGTTVYLNRAFHEADVVFGIGGIYPNHTAGFGGGTKLILGVLGIHSIYSLHFRNASRGWGEEGVDASFRRELDEIAALAGLNFVISPIIDGDRKVINLFCGDPKEYFPDAVRYYRDIYETEGVQDADVVIADTYPNDLSLTFAHMKGFSPLAACAPGVSRIAVASCDEGMGLHNIWPFVNRPPNHRWQHFWRIMGVKPGRQTLARAWSMIKRRLFKRGRAIGPGKNLIWLYRTGGRVDDFLGPIPGMRVTDNWEEIIAAVRREHPEKVKLKAQVYPCAFLQLLREETVEAPVAVQNSEEMRSSAMEEISDQA